MAKKLILSFKPRLSGAFFEKICYNKILANPARNEYIKESFQTINTIIIMKKNLFIFRHGETDNNLSRIWQGCTINEGLNNFGKKQAEKLGDLLSEIKFDRIYSSPLLRARQTAEIVSQKQRSPTPIIFIDDLRECNFGLAEGKDYDSLRQTFGKLVNQIQNPTFRTWDQKFPGSNSESKHEVFQRVFRQLLIIVAQPGKNFAVSVHAGVLSALACGLQLKNVSCNNTSVLHLQYNTLDQEIIKI